MTKHDPKKPPNPVDETGEMDGLGLEAVVRGQNGAIAGTISLHSRRSETGQPGLYGVGMIVVSGRRLQAQFLAVRKGSQADADALMHGAGQNER